MRGVCSWWIRQNPEQIGGVGIIAEIDEVNVIYFCILSKYWKILLNTEIFLTLFFFNL